MDSTSENIEKLCKSRHPSYEEMSAHWTFLDATYEGGREWFKDNIHRYFKEGNREYRDRVKRAYRFNHTREIVNLINKYIFKPEIKRSSEAPDEIKDFWENATRDQVTMDQFMRRVDISSSKFGKIWIVVDSTATGEEVSRADEKEKGVRPYAYIVTPLDALNMSFDEDGNLNWILIHERVRDDEDPMNFTGKITSQYRLWTRNSWHLFKKQGGSAAQWVEDEHAEHNLGVVPVFAHNATDDESDDLYTSPAIIGDIAYLDKAIANYLSNLDAIIQDQTFSQLAIPAGMRDSEGNSTVIELGTKRVFEYEGSENAKPFYLSPDVKQAELIITAIKQIINEIYHSVGVAGERTKQDNSAGIDNSSGVAKAFDFDRVASLLVMKAKGLQQTELRMLYLAQLYRGNKDPVLRDDEKQPFVKYPETFDIRSLEDELKISKELSGVQAPPEMQREQMRRVSRKMFSDSKSEVRNKIDTDIKSWPPDPMEMIGAAGAAKTIPKPRQTAAA